MANFEAPDPKDAFFESEPSGNEDAESLATAADEDTPGPSGLGANALLFMFTGGRPPSEFASEKKPNEP